MDYKYIEQLMERYWAGETSLEEEQILRAFFSQKDVPAGLQAYKDLLAYQRSEVEADTLGADFDARMAALVDEPAPVKARTVSLTQRLMPLFKAAAVVAMFLTLGNAAQVAFTGRGDEPSTAVYQRAHEGPSVAMGDSAKVDTVKQANAAPAIIK